MTASRPLGGARIVITRPAGTAAPLARAVRDLGGEPILFPGTSLRPPADPPAARLALERALGCDVVVFTSPAAARFARRLAPLRSRAMVLAPGAGTRRALQRTGIANALAPSREDSEGILDLDVLRDVGGRSVGIIGAAGGRGLLGSELAKRGAEIVHAHVYRRLPARLDQRHRDVLLQGGPHEPLYVLLSSAEALSNILAALADDARLALLAGTAVVSSARLADAARRAGFVRGLRAASTATASLLAAITNDRTNIPC